MKVYIAAISIYDVEHDELQTDVLDNVCYTQLKACNLAMEKIKEMKKELFKVLMESWNDEPKVIEMIADLYRFNYLIKELNI